MGTMLPIMWPLLSKKSKGNNGARLPGMKEDGPRQTRTQQHWRMKAPHCVVLYKEIEKRGRLSSCPELVLRFLIMQTGSALQSIFICSSVLGGPGESRRQRGMVDCQWAPPGQVPALLSPTPFLASLRRTVCRRGEVLPASPVSAWKCGVMWTRSKRGSTSKQTL